MVSIYEPIERAAEALRYGTLLYRFEIRAGKIYRIVEHEPPRRAWTREDLEHDQQQVE